MKRSPLRARRPDPEQQAAEAAVRAVVFARDGGCLMRHIDGARCYGRPTLHHLHKSGQGGPYTAANGVCLCMFHNGEVEDEPGLYLGLGLTVARGIDHSEAARRRTLVGITPKGPAHPSETG